MKAKLLRALDVWLGGDRPTPGRLCLSAIFVLSPALVAHAGLWMVSQQRERCLPPVAGIELPAHQNQAQKPVGERLKSTPNSAW